MNTRLPALRASFALLLLGGFPARPVVAQAGSPTDRLDAAVAAAEAAPYPPASDATFPVYVEDVRRG